MVALSRPQSLFVGQLTFPRTECKEAGAAAQGCACLNIRLTIIGTFPGPLGAQQTAPQGSVECAAQYLQRREYSIKKLQSNSLRHCCTLVRHRQPRSPPPPPVNLHGNVHQVYNTLLRNTQKAQDCYFKKYTKQLHKLPAYVTVDIVLLTHRPTEGSPFHCDGCSSLRATESTSNHEGVPGTVHSPVTCTRTYEGSFSKTAALHCRFFNSQRKQHKTLRRKCRAFIARANFWCLGCIQVGPCTQKDVAGLERVAQSKPARGKTLR